jgi:hypothetical protein
VAVLIALVFIAGIAAVLVGGGLVVATLTAYSGCTDECHGAAFWGGNGFLILGVGVLILLVGVALLSQRDSERNDAINRELRELFRRS